MTSDTTNKAQYSIGEFERYTFQYNQEYRFLKGFVPAKDKVLMQLDKSIIKCDKTLKNMKDKCMTIFKTDDNKSITGLDYSYFDSHFYAILNGHFIHRCSLDNSEPCREVYNSVPKVHAMKAEFGAIWLYNVENNLLKCLYANEKLDCKLFHQFDNAYMYFSFKSIVTSNDNLYIFFSNYNGAQKMTRCQLKFTKIFKANIYK